MIGADLQKMQVCSIFSLVFLSTIGCILENT